MSQGNNSSRHGNKRHIKRYEILPYINRPILYLLISMIIVIPVMVMGMSYAVDYVHTAQRTFVKDAYDIKVDDKLADANSLSVGAFMGNVVCENAGLNTKVYYGVNRATLRDGAGMCYIDGVRYITGDASSSFGSLYNVKKGDKIVFDSVSYRVTEIKKQSTDEKIKLKDGSVVLVTALSKDAFSVYNGKGYYVIALPEKEVQ